MAQSVPNKLRPRLILPATFVSGLIGAALFGWIDLQTIQLKVQTLSRIVAQSLASTIAVRAVDIDGDLATLSLPNQDLLTRIRGSNLLNLDLKKVRTELLENPLLQSVRVKKSFPDRLIISVDEAKLIALAEFRSSVHECASVRRARMTAAPYYYALAEDGTLYGVPSEGNLPFPSTIPLKLHKFPLIRLAKSVNLRPGDVCDLLGKFVREVRELLDALESNLLLSPSDLSELSWDPTSRLWEITLRQVSMNLLISLDTLALNARRLGTVLKDLRARNVQPQTLILSLPNQIVIVPRGAPA